MLVALALVLPRAAASVAGRCSFGLLLGVLVVVKVLDSASTRSSTGPSTRSATGPTSGPGRGARRLDRPAGRDRGRRRGRRRWSAYSSWCCRSRRVRLTRAAAGIGGATARALDRAGRRLGAVRGVRRRRSAGRPVASTSAAGLAVDEVQQVRADLARPPDVRRRDRDRPYAGEPGRPAADGAARQGRAARLRRELRPGRGAGHVVLRRASTPCSTTGTRQLRAAGYSSRSAFLTSPTFGAAQLAGALDAAVRAVGRQPARYGQLLGADRLTLTERVRARPAGAPSSTSRPNTEDWPEGEEFYGFDQMYDARNVGYAGPGVRLRVDARPVHPRPLPPRRSSRRRPAARHGRDRPGLQPPPVDAAAAAGALGPGRRRLGLRRDARAGRAVGRGVPRPRRGPAGLRRVDRVHAGHAWCRGSSSSPTRTSCSSCSATTSRTPTSAASDAGHDVPISVIAQDPAVHAADLRAGAGRTGCCPRPDAPVWRMDAFRDRFLAAYGPRPE